MIKVLMSLVLVYTLIGCSGHKIPEQRYEMPKQLYEISEEQSEKIEYEMTEQEYASPKKQRVNRRASSFLFVGDSLLVDLGPQIAKNYPQREQKVFIQKAKVSTGLCNTKFYNWEAKIGECIRLYHPDVVIVSLGTNDNQGLMTLEGSVAYPSKAWNRQYKERARKFIHIAQSRGARLVWLLPPVMGNAKMDAEVKAIKAILRTLCREEKILSYDMDRVLAGKNGRFKKYGADGVPLRARDGVHISHEGDSLLAQEIIALLQKI